MSASFDSGTQAIDDIAGLAEPSDRRSRTPSGTVRTLEKIGGDIDTLLTACSSLPIGPDYNPQAGLGDTLGTLADTLEGTPRATRRHRHESHRFHRFRRRTPAAARRPGELCADVSDDLADTGSIVDQYRASVADARALALETNNDLSTGVVLMRILLVVGGITLLLGQIVPLWLGRSLLDDADAMGEVDTSGGADQAPEHPVIAP